jgi:hypothetical protein
MNYYSITNGNRRNLSETVNNSNISISEVNNIIINNIKFYSALSFKNHNILNSDEL